MGGGMVDILDVLGKMVYDLSAHEVHWQQPETVLGAKEEKDKTPTPGINEISRKISTAECDR